MAQNTRVLPLGCGFQLATSNAHTFGTDAVLLAHFAAPRANDRAADLGTGCGIIPFLWRRDNKTAYAAGIDIAAPAIALARQSLARNGVARQLEFFEADLKNPFQYLPKASFDLVTCNPPYKAAGAGIPSKAAAEQTARHEVCCTLRDVVATAAALLRFGGRLALCQRPERLSEIFSLMTEYKIEPKRLRLVCKTADRPPWLVLVEGRLGGGKGLKILNNLSVYNREGALSAEMQEIYGPYLNL